MASVSPRVFPDRRANSRGRANWRTHMTIILRNQKWPWILALSIPLVAVACGGTATLQKEPDAATAPTAAWTKAVNTGDAAALAALYAEDARTFPPGGPAVSGRANIEAYWRDDLGEGGVKTTLTPNDVVAQGDLVQIAGTYEVDDNNGIGMATGQYQQLWSRTGGDWQLQREMWRIDPALQRETANADQLTGAWTSAYNGGDAKALLALYADDAAVSTVQEGTVEGKPAIEFFWTADLSGKPNSTLTLTDVYMAGELAHLEGEYKVTESGKITSGRFIQLWMRDPEGWRIHREMWWR
jgi:ketosteroid isomerase-like protein